MTSKNNNDTNMPEDQSEVSELEELREKVVEYETGWKRALADYQNLKKRVEESRQETILHANEALMDKLIHVLAHLGNLEKYIEDEGFSLVLNEFRYILESEGLKEINPENEMFNPDFMDAIEPVPGEKNIVVEVLQKGYLINEKLIRPASVKVGNGEDPVETSDEKPETETSQEETEDSTDTSSEK